MFCWKDEKVATARWTGQTVNTTIQHGVPSVYNILAAREPLCVLLPPLPHLLRSSCSTCSNAPFCPNLPANARYLTFCHELIPPLYLSLPVPTYLPSSRPRRCWLLLALCRHSSSRLPNPACSVRACTLPPRTLGLLAHLHAVRADGMSARMAAFSLARRFRGVRVAWYYHCSRHGACRARTGTLPCDFHGVNAAAVHSHRRLCRYSNFSMVLALYFARDLPARFAAGWRFCWRMILTPFVLPAAGQTCLRAAGVYSTPGAPCLTAADISPLFDAPACCTTHLSLLHIFC